MLCNCHALLKGRLVRAFVVSAAILILLQITLVLVKTGPTASERDPLADALVIFQELGHRTPLLRHNFTQRLLCWIPSRPSSVRTKARHVWATWASRCDTTVFISAEPSDDVPTVVLPLPEGRGHLTVKTMAAFSYLYDHHLDEHDWFLKADDDTYVIVENLRLLLSRHSSSQAHVFGHHIPVDREAARRGYLSGGAGYVLSREALRVMVEEGVRSDRCHSDGGSEDLEVTRCLETAGVQPEDSHDALGRSRFHPHALLSYLTSKECFSQQPEDKSFRVSHELEPVCVAQSVEPIDGPLPFSHPLDNVVQRRSQGVRGTLRSPNPLTLSSISGG